MKDTTTKQQRSDMQTRRRLGRIAAGLVGLGLGMSLATSAFAQAPFPTKPVRLVITFPPGGSADVVARTMAPRMSERLGQQVLVENRPGAGGNIGIDLVAKSAPDGYTIGLGAAGALAVNTSLYAKMPYDPIKDLAPVSLVAIAPFVVIAGQATGFTSLKDLIAAAKARPGQLAIGHGGNGTAMHLTAELFKMMAGVDVTLVPYKGSAPATTAVVSGEVPVAITDGPSLQPHLRGGRMVPLAATSPRRLSTLPDVPTMIESGLAGYESVGWFGIVAPAGTPQDVIARLNGAINAALSDAEVRERVLASGAEPSPGTPQAFGEFIRSEIPKWARVVKVSGAKVE
jgi:tripartite-type tricarboxylate transporter receptor subunit TctC